jgi:ABC-2 type transport system ATP-binding protein
MGRRERFKDSKRHPKYVRINSDPARGGGRVVPIGEIVLRADGIRKSFGARVVLDGVSMSVKAGEIVGLLGPNGAGKTTTLSILATLLEPDAGEIRVGGVSAAGGRRAIRGKIGFVPQSIALYPSLSAVHNLRLFARIHGVARAAAHAESLRMLEAVGLADRAHEPVAVLSGGMKRRLNLACGMVHRPEVLLLDEPSVGVDPQSREQILATVRKLADGGVAAVYSTHYMEEIERVADRVLLIDNGRVMAEGTVAELIALGGHQPRMEIRFQKMPAGGWTGGIDAGCQSATIEGDKVTLVLPSFAAVTEALDRARAAGGEVGEFSVHSPNLSDAFIALTGHALRDPGAETH